MKVKCCEMLRHQDAVCSRVGVGSAYRIVALVGCYEPTAQVLLYPYTRVPVSRAVVNDVKHHRLLAWLYNHHTVRNVMMYDSVRNECFGPL